MFVRRILFPVIITAVLSVSLASYAIVHHKNQQVAARTNSKTMQSSNQAKQVAVANTQTGLQAAKTTPSAANTQPVTTQATAKSTAPTTKYATSSDPASTAYSTTPPPANPASFTTAIVRANQVPAGTVISYNAIKGERTIYGGDLIISNPILSYSLSDTQRTYQPTTFTASTPDGATVSTPSNAYNDRGGISAVMDASLYKSTGASFDMRYDIYNHNLGPGTYTLHMIAYRTGQATDAYEYDGFLTIVITQ